MQESPSNSRFAIFKAALIIGLPLCTLYLYNYSNLTLWYNDTEVKKIDSGDDLENLGIVRSEVKRGSVNADTVSSIKTTVKDSIPQRVLLIGDSEAGGLIYPLDDYCEANGHTLLCTFTYESSTILDFAKSSKVDELIENYRPTMIFFVVGLNELYAKDLKRRKAAALRFVEKFKGVNYLWIGPANFDEDFGINDVFNSAAEPGKFFYTKELEIPRGKDGRHPNKKGYELWMKSLANHIQQSNLYDFRFDPPSRFDTRVRGRLLRSNTQNE